MERENEALYKQPDYIIANKLTKEGKQEIQKRWQAIFDGKTYAEINSELPEILDGLTDSQWDKKIKKSFRIRARAVQRREYAEEIKDEEHEFHNEYLMLREQFPDRRDTDIAAFLLRNNPDGQDNKDIRDKEIQDKEDDRDKDNKNDRKINFYRVLGMAFLAVGIWGAGQLYYDNSQIKRAEASDRNIAPIIEQVAKTEPTIIYQATSAPTAIISEQIIPTETLFPPATETPIAAETATAQEPFMLGKIDLSKTVTVKVDGTPINFENMPMANWDSAGWNDSLVNSFNKIENPHDTLISETDRPELLTMTGHSFSLHGEKLPFDPLIRLTAQDLIGKKVTLQQGDISQELVITYTGTIGVGQYNNSIASGVDGQPMYLRSDFGQDNEGNKIGLGIPDSVRNTPGLVMIACTGEKSSNPEEKYTERRIVVANIVETKESTANINSYVREAEYLTGKINEYKLTHLPGNTEKLGTYLKNTEWYRNKNEEQKNRLESTLSVLDNKTYAYNGEKGPQAAQCIDFVSLMSALNYPESPKNVGAISGVGSARDIIDTAGHKGFEIKGNAWDIGLRSIEPGDLVMFGAHFVVVLENNPQSGAIFADVNREMDGEGTIYYALNDTELRGLFPPGSVVGRQMN